MTSQPLTRNMIERAIKRVRNERPRVCGLDMPHLLHSKDAETGGACWNCGVIVDARLTSR